MLCMCMCTVLFACGGNSIEDFDDNSQKEAKSVESQGTLDSGETGDLEKTTSLPQQGHFGLSNKLFFIRKIVSVKERES